MKVDKIGTVLYGVYKKYVDEKLMNGKVVVGKVVSYENINGEIYPIVREVGTRNKLYHTSLYFYNTLEEAIEVIITKKKKK